MNKVYEIITAKIIEELQKGIVPWQMPWISGPPANLVSKKPYRGLNTLLLNSHRYSSPYFLTLKQANDLGGQVKQGEKSHMVVFWKQWETEDRETGKEVKIPLLRYYRVFHVSQCSGVADPFEKVKNEIPAIEQCEKIVAGMSNPPQIQTGEPRAYYRPSEDTVNMPDRGLFKNSESYYNTLFHELIHSTGHESRLNRKGISEINVFASHEYSKEELIAEIGACFLTNHASLTGLTFNNSVAYIQGWIKRLKDDPTFIVKASAGAQKAADFILGIQESF